MTLTILFNFILRKNSETTEYKLMQFLQSEHPDFFEALGDSPSLYQKHFILFNALYRLRNKLIEQRKSIIIEPTKIRVIDVDSNTSELSYSDNLSEFYLARENLNLSEKEVAEMLSLFWQKYLAIDQKAEALRCFDLTDSTRINKRIIKKRYAKLAKLHHPDHGGDSDEFIKIKKSAEVLLSLFD